MEHLREFGRGMFAAYAKLEKAFQSVHGEALWDILQLCGIPAKIIDLLIGLYCGTESEVWGRCVHLSQEIHSLCCAVQAGACNSDPPLWSVDTFHS